MDETKTPPQSGPKRIRLIRGNPAPGSTPTTGVRPSPFHKPIKGGSHKPFAFSRAQRGNR